MTSFEAVRPRTYFAGIFNAVCLRGLPPGAVATLSVLYAASSLSLVACGSQKTKTSPGDNVLQSGTGVPVAGTSQAPPVAGTALAPPVAGTALAPPAAVSGRSGGVIVVPTAGMTAVAGVGGMLAGAAAAPQAGNAGAAMAGAGGQTASDDDAGVDMAGSGGGSGGSGGGSGGSGGGSGGAGGGSGGAGGSAAAGAGGAPAARSCTGKPGKQRGKVTQMISVGNTQRNFIYYAPAGLDANKPVPFVVVAHGFNTTAEQMYALTDYTKIADREKLVVAFPEGPSLRPWNVGMPDCTSTVLGLVPSSTADDQAFLDAVIKFAKDDQCVDESHVFMTGFSLGAYFTNRTGCLREDIRAIVPHSGGFDQTGCKAKPKPVMLIHFDGDELIPYMCGAQARDRWLALNGCNSSEAPEVVMIRGGHCDYYKGCPANGQVAMCTLMIPPGGDEVFAGHAWSGGSLAMEGIGPWVIPETESAAELGWAFFKKYAW